MDSVADILENQWAKLFNTNPSDIVSFSTSTAAQLDIVHDLLLGIDVLLDKLAINWITGSPAPEVVLGLLSCKCRRVCQAPDCECLVNAHKCTDVCCLQDCSNVRTDVDEQQEQDSSDDEV